MSLSMFGLLENQLAEAIGRNTFYGVAAIFIPLVIAYAMTKQRKSYLLWKIQTPFVVLLLINIIYWLSYANEVSSVFLIQYVVVICCFYTYYYAANMTNYISRYNFVALLGMAILGLYAAMILLDPGLALRGAWSGGFANPNVFGLFMFMLVCVITCSLHVNRAVLPGLVVIVVAVAALLIFSSRSRSGLLALGMFLATYYIWPYIGRRASFGFAYLLGVIALIVFLTFSGAERIQLPPILNVLLEDFSSSYEKNVDSGRSQLWNAALDLISDRPLFGWGTGSTTQNVLNSGLSFHNWYLTVAYHFGLVGITLYIILFVGIWQVFCSMSSHPLARAAASSLAGLLMTQVYEVSLTQNNLNMGLVFWALFGLAVGVLARSRCDRINHPLPVGAGLALR